MKNVITVFDMWRAYEYYEKTGYTLKQLTYCIDENRRLLANWYLVYHSGRSFKKIFSDRFEHSFGFGKSERFMKKEWLSHSDESFWVDKEEKPGYYLLNFGREREEDECRKLRFESITFSQQESVISSLKKRRAPLNVVTEAVFSIYDMTGVLLLKGWNHLSDTRTYDGRLLYIGNTASKASGEKIMNIFGFPKKQESDPKHYFGFGAVLMMEK